MAKETCIVCRAPGEPCEDCEERPVFCDSHGDEHRARFHRASRTTGGASSRSVDDALAAQLAEEGIDYE